ncbi:family 10 glycosylhydrolase, partial [Streptomyces sp. NPDC006668]|uniref:glycoside hydrolase family 10 protein n=1 Tax=Streptomyces sp. NPDC006668 TaxID=3156903 RepID=UPI0033ECA03D
MLHRRTRLSRRAFAVTALSALVAGGGAMAAGAAMAGGSDTSDDSGRRKASGRMRGVWVATVTNRDWPSRPGLTVDRQKAELTAILDRAVEDRLNAVILQVRPTADALWPSPYEPWSDVLTGTQGKAPGWDPLGTAVKEAHARGLELHAWFNPYRIANHTDPTRLVASHPARRHPDWVVTYGGKMYYNPGLPQVR